MSDVINDLSFPEWVEKEAAETGGLDLLGLRNVAQSISTYCLNGITTISPQIRYLGIRAWILQMYSECQLPDDYKTYIKFGANLEAAVAIGTKLNDTTVTGIVGSTKAEEIIENSNDTIEIDRLVSQLVINMYTGPSIDLGIAFQRESGITGLTKERGELLANSIMEKVNDLDIVKKIFFKKKVEQFSHSELMELGKILSINNIPEEEREILIDIIIPPNKSPIGWDNDIRRVATYTLLLKLAKKLDAIPTVDKFFEEINNPSEDIREIFKEILDGWLCFLIRDSLAVAHEKALDIINHELEVSPNESITRKRLLSTLLNDYQAIITELSIFGIPVDQKTHKELRFNDVLKIVEDSLNFPEQNSTLQRWDNTNFNEKFLIEEIQSKYNESAVLLPIVWILSYLRTKNMDDDNELLAGLSKGGWGRLGLKEVIIPSIEKWKIENPKFYQVVFELLDRTIDQHVRICWSRMATDINKDVSVIKSDGDRIQFRKKFEAGRTASRVKEAIGWLQQLQLINETGISKEGEKVLERGLNTLKEYCKEEK